MILGGSVDAMRLFYDPQDSKPMEKRMRTALQHSGVSKLVNHDSSR